MNWTQIWTTTAQAGLNGFLLGAVLLGLPLAVVELVRYFKSKEAARLNASRDTREDMSEKPKHQPALCASAGYFDCDRRLLRLCRRRWTLHPIRATVHPGGDMTEERAEALSFFIVLAVGAILVALLGLPGIVGFIVGIITAVGTATVVSLDDFYE
jgi:hypothetical protein